MKIRDDAPRVGRAVAQGVVAAMAMSGMRVVTTNVGWVVQPPPDQIAKEEAPTLIGKLPEQQQAVAKELAHWTYGAFGGAGYALLPSWVHRRRWAGISYGVLTWLVFEVLIAPALDLPHTRQRRLAEGLALAVDHLLYGVVVGETDRMEPLGPRRLRRSFGSARRLGRRRRSRLPRGRP